MGCIRKPSFCANIHKLTVSFIIVMILSSSHARFIRQDGWNSKLIDNDTRVIKNQDKYDGKMGMIDIKAGSRPPPCLWKKYCRECDKCEAIQVPIIGPRTITRSRSTNTRTDDSSNYKPLCWKCKCGDFIFNP